MRDVVVLMGISIDGNVSGAPEQDIVGGEAEHEDVVARKMEWVGEAGVHPPGRLRSGDPMLSKLPTGRRLELGQATPHLDGIVISSYRRP